MGSACLNRRGDQAQTAVLAPEDLQEQEIINNKGNIGLIVIFFPVFSSLMMVPCPCLLLEDQRPAQAPSCPSPAPFGAEPSPRCCRLPINSFSPSTLQQPCLHPSPAEGPAAPGALRGIRARILRRTSIDPEGCFGNGIGLGNKGSGDESCCGGVSPPPHPM